MNKLIFIVSLFVVVLNPGLVYAQPADPAPTTTGSLPTYSGVEDSIGSYLCTPTGDGADLQRCINRLYRFGITAGALVLVAMVVFAGYLYITSGETGKGKAKAILMNSLVGMAMLLGSYALLYFINPNLVTFRAIQPPIFEANELPSCTALGLAKDNNCAITADAAEQVDTTPSAGGGAYAECQGGIVAITGIPRVGSQNRICQELLSKMQPLLEQFKSQAPGYFFGISSTIRNRNAESDCHYDNRNPAVAGNCADTVLRTTAGAKVPGNHEAWGKLCRLLLGAGLSLANETGSAHEGCRKPSSYQFTNGAHFHVYVPAR